jgi:hypothetical protein
MEADDDGLYVLKFHGAAQGPKALTAELLGGEIARALGLPVPELVFIELDPVLGRSEPHFEIQGLIKRSAGLNLALDYLPGSLGFEALDAPGIDPLLASSMVWLDSFIMNVDRTARNPNMLFWHKKLYLIDHGASFYFQYFTGEFLARSRAAFPQIKDHVLLPQASQLQAANQQLKPRLTPETLQEIVNLIPDLWLDEDLYFPNRDAHRAAYLTYLQERLSASELFVEEAQNARNPLI